MLRRRTRTAAAFAAASLLVLAACGGGDNGGELRLDGSPRFPDDEGVATSLTRESITLDRERTYKVSDRLRSFSTYTLQIEPMLNRKGQYVQIGLDGKSMVWMAGVAAPVRTGEGSNVFYVGELERIEDEKAVFADGTVLRLAKGVRADPGRAQARIDVRTRAVAELRPVAR